ncbi:MAG: pilus assembly protein [Rhizobiaceae bacterium]|nr:pilus assembly protein [Rhizobiaceae bacterium]
MLSLASRFRRDRAGTSAVEFAILAGPLALLLFGSLEFGRLYWTRQALQETAIAGARCMGVKQSNCATNGVYSSALAKKFIKDIAEERGLTLTDSDVILAPNTSCSGLSGFSSVTINYTFDTPLPSVIAALADGMALTASACFPNQSI